jgi:hypothetical protein
MYRDDLHDLTHAFACTFNFRSLILTFHTMSLEARVFFPIDDDSAAAAFSFASARFVALFAERCPEIGIATADAASRLASRIASDTADQRVDVYVVLSTDAPWNVGLKFRRVSSDSGGFGAFFGEKLEVKVTADARDAPIQRWVKYKVDFVAKKEAQSKAGSAAAAAAAASSSAAVSFTQALVVALGKAASLCTDPIQRAVLERHATNLAASSSSSPALPFKLLSVSKSRRDATIASGGTVFNLEETDVGVSVGCDTSTTKITRFRSFNLEAMSEKKDARQATEIIAAKFVAAAVALCAPKCVAAGYPSFLVSCAFE